MTRRYVHWTGVWAGKTPLTTTITAAIAASSTDDVIEVSGGEDGHDYAEFVTIDTKVTLEGSKDSGHNGVPNITGTGSSHCVLFSIDDCTVNRMKMSGAPAGSGGVVANSTITSFEVNDCLLDANGYQFRNVNLSTAGLYVFNRCKLSNESQATVLGGNSLSVTTFNFCQFSGGQYGIFVGADGAVECYNCTAFVSERNLMRSTGATLLNVNGLFIGGDTVVATTDLADGGANCTCRQCMAFGHFLQATPPELLTDFSVIDGGDNLSGVAEYSAVGKIYDSYRYPALSFLIIDDLENTDHWATLCGIAQQSGVKVGLGVSGDPTSDQYDTMADIVNEGTGYLIGHSHTATQLNASGPIQIAYGGAGTPTVDVTNTGTDLDSTTWGGSLVLKVNAGAVATFDLTNASYDTIAELVSAIGAVSNWTAQKTASFDVSNTLPSLVLDAVTAGAVTATITDTTLAYNRDRVHTTEIGDQIDRIDAAMAARGVTSTIDSFYPHGNVFDSTTQDYCLSIGLVGMRTLNTGDKDMENFNVYQAAAIAPADAFGSTSEAQIKRNVAGFAESLHALGWCIGVFSHTAVEYSVANWTSVFEEIVEHGVNVLTFAQAMRHISGNLTGILPKPGSSDSMTYTRTLVESEPRLCKGSAAGPAGIRQLGTFSTSDVNRHSTGRFAFIGCHAPHANIASSVHHVPVPLSNVLA